MWFCGICWIIPFWEESVYEKKKNCEVNQTIEQISQAIRFVEAKKVRFSQLSLTYEHTAIKQWDQKSKVKGTVEKHTLHMDAIKNMKMRSLLQSKCDYLIKVGNLLECLIVEMDSAMFVLEIGESLLLGDSVLKQLSNSLTELKIDDCQGGATHGITTAA